MAKVWERWEGDNDLQTSKLQHVATFQNIHDVTEAFGGRRYVVASLGEVEEGGDARGRWNDKAHNVDQKRGTTYAMTTSCPG